MKVYIATNKDNKDALMHYGVKGMRWGKRGGRFKWPWEKDDPSAGYKPKSSRNSRKELAKTIGKMYKTSPTTYGGIRGSSQFYKEHGQSGMRRRVNGNTNMTIALSQYPAKRREHLEGNRKMYNYAGLATTRTTIPTGKIKTSQKTSSAANKRVKQYFQDKVNRQRADDKKKEQQRLTEYQRRHGRR